jgi:hypothetical protein
VYLITRRCTQRQFLLRPSSLTNQVFTYCLAVAAEETGVQIHGVAVLSNHWHGVVSDPLGTLPEFLALLHKLVAKALNALLGRWENFWSSDKTSVVRLVDEHEVLDKMAYVQANPTTAGLVKSPDLWPGLLSRHVGETLEVEMPDVFFDDEGQLPHEATLQLVRPPIYRELDTRELDALLVQEVGKRVRRARGEMRQVGKSFLGPKTVLRQATSAQPKTPEPRRNLSPRIACKSTEHRVRALNDLKRFLGRYREAWARWRNGDRQVEFPFGTYAMRLRDGVRCVSMVPG